MNIVKPTILALVIAVAALPATSAIAAPQRVTGAATLAGLLYGRDQTVQMPDGTTFDVHYDSNGVMYSKGKPTGTITKATGYSWCNFTGSKLNACVTIWKNGGAYAAKNNDGTYAFAFTVH